MRTITFLMLFTTEKEKKGKREMVMKVDDCMRWNCISVENALFTRTRSLACDCWVENRQSIQCVWAKREQMKEKEVLANKHHNHLNSWLTGRFDSSNIFDKITRVHSKTMFWHSAFVNRLQLNEPMHLRCMHNITWKEMTPHNIYHGRWQCKWWDR